MDELDMSRPGSELFPEDKRNYSSYDVQDPFVGDAGVEQLEVAAPAVSDKELNFRALREETAKLKAESEYWRGQAEAYSSTHKQPEAQQQDAYAALDWEDSSDIQKAFTQLRKDNDHLRNEVRDQIAAANAKSTYQDWNQMVTQHVPQLTNKNPMFAEMIKNASNPYEAAYLLAELNAGASQPPPANGNAQRVMSNAAKPRSPQTVGGQGQLSQTDYYANMSDEDFMKIASRNLANI